MSANSVGFDDPDMDSSIADKNIRQKFCQVGNAIEWNAFRETAS